MSQVSFLDFQVLMSLSGAFVTTLTLGFLLVRFSASIEAVSIVRNDHAAVQASHTGNPPRLGGVAVIVGMLVGSLLLSNKSSGNYTILFFGALAPVFGAGLWEDLGFGVAAKGRFLASFISASVAVVLLGHWMTRGDLWVLDGVLGFVPAGVFLTVFTAAVFCHAVNLIDGMNGLAASIVIASSLGLSYVAAQVGLQQVTILALLLAATTLAFFLLNWPLGKLFLGDAGAYGLGHILIWLGISIIALAPNFAMPAMILILFYPFADTLHTVTRRLMEHKKITEPDKMHLHHKIRRALEIIWIGQDRRAIANPLTVVFMLPMVAGPVLLGAMLWDQPTVAWRVLTGFSVAFVGLHFVIIAVAKHFRNTALSARRNSQHFVNVSARQALGGTKTDGYISPYSGLFIQDAVAVEVRISQPSSADPWRLMTIADNARDRVWNDTFETDLAAWEFFLAQVEGLGMDAVIGARRLTDREQRFYDAFHESGT